jgi:CubicO group peptidase (beta-lactamase class C family)
VAVPPPVASSELVADALGELAGALDLVVMHRTEVVEAVRIGAPAAARFPVFSISKTVTAATVLTLVDAGVLSLETTVASLLPAFASRGKGAVTVADVLSHRGGFPDRLRPPEAIRAFRDPEAAMADICDLPFVPELYGVGTYHGVAYSVLGAVVERVAGRTFASYCSAAVLEPLGMTDSSWGLPAGTDAVELTGVNRLDWDEIAMRGSVIPAGNLWSTAADITRLLLMLRGGGELAERRVLSRSSVAAMTRPHVAARGQAGARAFGFGLLIGSEPGSVSGRGASASAGCYGHAGGTSAQAWYEPQGDVTLVALSNGCPDQSQSDARFERLSDRARALYAG